MANIVEAILRSKYEDGIEKGVENTRKAMESGLSAMHNAAAAMASGVEKAFEVTASALEGWRKKLSQAADESDSSFKKISLGAAALGLALVEVFIRATKAVGEFILDTVKEASALFEVKTAFEAVTEAMGVQADVLLKQLKVATEGQISSITLMRNAQKVLQAELPITGAQYAELVENVFRLAKSQGKDATGAQDALTDALIRGNSRGLGPAIGIHLAVKDAVNEMTRAMTDSGEVMSDRTRVAAFYNELIEKTTGAVGLLGKAHLTVEDIINQTDRTWKGLIATMGVGILRSGVVQELLEKTSQALLGVSVSGENQNKIALQTNEIVINLIRGFATFLDVMGAVKTVVAIVIDTAFIPLNLFFLVLETGFAVLAGLAYAFLESLAHIPKYGAAFREAADSVKAATDTAIAGVQRHADALAHAYSGAVSGAFDLADGARKLADEVSKAKDETVKTEAGIRKLGDGAGAAAVDLKKLAEQMAAYRALLLSMQESEASDEQKNALKLAARATEINKFDMLTASQKRQLYDAAQAEFEAAENKRIDKEVEKSVEELEKTAAQQQKLLDQRRDFENQLNVAALTGQQKAEAQLRASFAKIDDLTQGDDAARSREQRMATEVYVAEIERLRKAAVQKQQEMDAELLSAAVTGEQKAQAQLQKHFDDIAKLEQVSDGTRYRLQKEAVQAYVVEIQKIRADASKKEIADAVVAANTIVRAVDLAQRGLLSRSVASDALAVAPQVIDTIRQKLAQLQQQKIVSDEQLQEITRLKEALEKLNSVNLSPFRQILLQLRNDMVRISGEITQAWGQFWSDLVTGQENAGRKFLAAVMNMIAQEVMGYAQSQALKAIAAAADLDFAGAARHAAAAAALAAGAGILSGLASSLSQAKPTAAAPAAPTAVGGGSSSSSQPAIQYVGAAGGPQSPQPQQVRHVVELQIQPNDAYIVKTVKTNINGNGQLRAVVKR